MEQQSIQIIFGLKVGQLREARNISLKQLAMRTGMSVSYLNEIEKGKKYPKMEKMLLLAQALETSYEDLVTPRLDGSLDPLAAVLASPLMRQFPFHLFGTSAREILQLMVGHPNEMGTLARMLSELGRRYDLRIIDLFHTALRCYQMLHHNYFPDLEARANDFRARNGLSADEFVSHEHMREALLQLSGLKIVEKDAEELPMPLRSQRFFYMPHSRELWLNRRLNAAQRGFLFARELGYHLLGIEDRPSTSPALQPVTFDHVFDNFRVSYFAGALLLPQKRFQQDLKRVFSRSSWAEAQQLLLALPAQYGVTPETLFYRMSELIPQCFKTQKVHFTKFARKGEGRSLVLEKQFNMSQLHIPNGIGLNEHFCGRWLSVVALDELVKDPAQPIWLGAQRSRFFDFGTDFFCLTVSYRGNLRPGELFSATVGFPLDPALKSTIKFWSDEAIPSRELGQTCERCPLSPGHCVERQVDPDLYLASRERMEQREALVELLSATN